MNWCFCSKFGSIKQSNASRIRSIVAEALEDITALFYDEECNEIYTGNRYDLVRESHETVPLLSVIVSIHLVSVLKIQS